METLEVIPDPTSLIESMRAVGYSTESAIADLVDNCVSAEAENIEIAYDASEDPYIALLDDGYGMTPDELTNAMRHGSHNPNDQREEGDLGRFGLGLKTASLSQCRKLTVVSKKNGVVSARQWNLDVVQSTGKWLVVVPNQMDLSELPLFKKLVQSDSGTLVVWQELDRLVAGARDPQTEMTVKLSPLLEHLSLVFHRYLDKEPGYKTVNLVLNGLKVPHCDPFLKGNDYRQPLEGQIIRHDRGNVIVTPYVLPPISHLTQDEIKLAGGKEGLRGTQGFYVYRNRRLVIWGTWFRLVPKQEFYKLTRIQVDIPNTFDELWGLDIKKSAAQPPDVIRTRLKELIPHFADRSRKTVTYPGRTANRTEFEPLWNRIEPRHGSFKYEVNADHPLIQQVTGQLDEREQRRIQAILDVLGDAIPLESIYADMCGDDKQDPSEVFGELLRIVKNIKDLTGLGIEEVLKIDPVARYPHQHDRIKEELADEQ